MQSADTLIIQFTLVGDLSRLAIPPPATPRRNDGLWHHTCFEAFLRGSDDAAYHEFNFSPSTQWAAYIFAGYRSGMRDAATAAPRIETRAGTDRYELMATFDLPAGTSRQLGLTAVIEEKNGTKSYWALAHPPEGPPDFHHPDCFVLELPPAG